MTDTIIRTSGDYTLNLNGGTTVVTARTYHLARAADDGDATASITLLPGKWIAVASQSGPDCLPSYLPSCRPGDALRTLVQHVARLHGALRVADNGHVAGILEGLALADDDGAVSYGPPEARDRDIAHHRTR